MTKRFLAASLLALAAVPASAQLTQFGWFGQLAGSCWRGTRADGKPADEQCYAAQYNRFLRGRIKFPPGERGTAEGDSVFAFDPQAKVVIYSQWSSNGGMGFGEAVLEGDELIFQNRLPDGSEALSRSVWRRVDAETYRVSRQRRSEAGDWNEESAVTYTRVRPAAPKG
jgi:hypothetical protein